MILPILLALFITSCNNKPVSTAAMKSEEADENIAVYLTGQTFRENVFDYKESKDWKYLGIKPAIIDFYADWCAPCRQLSPVLEDVVKEYNGQIILYKVDTDKEKELTGAIGVRALPTLLYIPVEGEPQVRMGNASAESIMQTIDKILLPQ